MKFGGGVIILLGALGNRGNGTCPTPGQIVADVKFVYIATGPSCSFGIDEEGSRWGWGYNGVRANLGNGITDTQNIKVPEKINDGISFVSIVSRDETTSGLDNEGNIWGWGYNYWGEVGDGTNGNYVVKSKPTKPTVEHNTKFISVSAGERYRLAIDEEGILWAWGNNGYGQLGDGTTTQKLVPQQITTDQKFIQVSAGGSHSLGIDENGNLWTWGYNKYGQLGDGTTTNRKNIELVKWN